MKSYKPFIKVYNDPKYYPNGLAFATKDEARIWAEDLLMRWMRADTFEVRESDEPVNYVLKRNAEGNWEMRHVNPDAEQVKQ